MSELVENLIGGCTLQAYSEAKKLPLEILSGLGLTQITYQGRPAIRIPYFDMRHEEVAVRYRIGLSGNDRFRWQKGAKPIPYGLWLLPDAIKAGQIIIVEGESDCHSLWLHGLPALGLPGAASWREQWAQFLDEIPAIYILVESDAGGNATLNWIAKSQIKNRVKLISMEAL
jgi:hypothetical protein